MTTLLRALLCWGLLVAADARAQSATERARVALDWRRVRDADVRRCGLSQLRAGTLERLVAAGYAVVEQPGSDGLYVTVASAQGGVEVEARSRGMQRDRRVALPSNCDATHVLEVIEAIEQLVAEVEHDRPRAAEAGEELDAGGAAETASQSTTRGAGFGLAAVLRMANPGTFLVGGAGLHGRYRFGVVATGVRAEVTAGKGGEVTVVEAALLVDVAFRPWPTGPVAFVIEAGPLLHHGGSAERKVNQADGQFGAGVGLHLGRRWYAQLLGYARPLRVQHTQAGEVVVDTSHGGLQLRIGAQLWGP